MSEPPRLNPEDFELTPRQLQRQFEAKIRPGLEGPSHDRPTIVCVTGPMASGKTTTMSAAPHIFDIPDAAQIDADDHVFAHPNYLGLREQYGERAARDLVRGPVAPLWNMSMDYVRDQRRNAVIAGPMTDADWFARNIAPFTEDGFRIEFVSVAVHESRSLLSTVDRYHQAESLRPGDGVFHDPAWHDRHYPGARSAIEGIEQRGLADGVHIAQRGGRIIYSNELLNRDPITWANPPRGPQELDAERSRLWTDDEHAHHHDRAITLLRSPHLDEEKRLVVADAILRSHEPNDRAVAQLSAEAEELATAVDRGEGPAVAALSADANEDERRQAEVSDRAAVEQLEQRAQQRAMYSSDLREAAGEWAADARGWQERPYGQQTGEQLTALFADTEERHTAANETAAGLRERPAAEQTDAWRYEALAAELSATSKAIHSEQVIRASLPPARAAAEQNEREQLREQGPASLDPEAAEAVRLLREQQRPTPGPHASSPTSSTPPTPPPNRARGLHAESDPGR